MAGGGIVWHGLNELEAAFAGLNTRVEAATRDGVVEAAHLAERYEKEEAGAGGHHQKGTPTTASKGGGPAVITGTLRRSITVGDIRPYGTGGWSAKIGPTAIYGRRVELEYGYAYTRPGFLRALPEFPAIYARAWARALA